MHFWTIGPYMPALKVKQCSTSLFSPKRTALDCLTRTDQYSSRYNAVLPATSTGLAFHLTAHIFFIRKWKASSITIYGNLSTRARSILECLLPFPLVPFFLPCVPRGRNHKHRVGFRPGQQLLAMWHWKRTKRARPDNYGEDGRTRTQGRQKAFLRPIILSFLLSEQELDRLHPSLSPFFIYFLNPGPESTKNPPINPNNIN